MDVGGAETMIMNLFREANKSDYIFDFVSHSKNEGYFDKEIIEMGGVIHYIPNFVQNPFKYIFSFRKIIKEYDYKVIHCHTLFNSGFTVLIGKFFSIPKRVVHAHSTGNEANSKIKKAYEDMSRIIINLCSTDIVACSTDAGLNLFGNKYMKKGQLIKNAISFDEVVSISRDLVQIERSKFSDDNTILIGQIGSFKDVKNHMFSLSLASKLKENNIKFRMLFIGDGQNRDAIVQKIDTLNLNDHVLLLGTISTVNLHLQLLDLLIMPSLFEGLPMTLIESQANGIPAIISANITSDVDLGLNLIKRLKIGENHDEWLTEILNIGNRNTSLPSIEKRIEKLQKSGYLVTDSFKKLTDVYFGG